FGFAENTDDLFVGKTLLHGDVLMWLMKTLLTSGCTNQRGAGHIIKLARRIIDIEIRARKSAKAKGKEAEVEQVVPSTDDEITEEETDTPAN
ncbi:hypothetical protein, partial [Citrobacter sp. W5]|uniref:hypothetical protein n=1 Tax=Citrobacter sp. W5 TaxID=2998569 RepID=UPI003FA3537D